MTTVAEPATPPNGQITLDDLTPDQISQLVDQLNERQNEDTELPTALQAILRVMQEVQFIAKGQEYKERNGEVKYRFRGVDAVMQVVGPALRRHGIVPVPWVEDIKQTESVNKNQTRMRETVSTITYRLYGPKGDHVEARISGEAADAGDKSVTKSESVAYRTLWLQLLCIPTNEPEPDKFNFERGSVQDQAANRQAQEPSREQLLSTVTSLCWELQTAMGVGEYDWLATVAKMCKRYFSVDVAVKVTDEGAVEEIDLSRLKTNDLHGLWSRLNKSLREKKAKDDMTQLAGGS